MLITTCSHCGARFRVTPGQLNARQGQVRCGMCRDVFNGFESLERHPDDDTGSRLLAAREAASKAAKPAPASAPPPEMLGGIETLESRMPEQQAPPASPRVPAAPTRKSASAAPARPAAADLTLPPPQRRPVSKAWAYGVAPLALVLAMELAYGHRGALAERYPALRPWLESACDLAGCAVAWARDNGALKLEDSELLEIPGKPNEIALSARIRNLGPVMEEYPYIELTLTDVTGQAAIRRVLRPSDYLGRPQGRGEGLAPGADMAIQLRLETARIKATGYELLLFYP